MTSPDVKEVSGKSFDCIVVGGGTAGRPLAATLSERLSVILVQRDGHHLKTPSYWRKIYFALPLLQTEEYTSLA